MLKLLFKKIHLDENENETVFIIKYGRQMGKEKFSVSFYWKHSGRS